MPSVAIRCKQCSREFGSMEAPTAKELRTMLAGSPFAAMAAFLPPDVAAELAKMPIYLCTTCQPLTRETQDGNLSTAGQQRPAGAAGSNEHEHDGPGPGDEPGRSAAR